MNFPRGKNSERSRISIFVPAGINSTGAISFLISPVLINYARSRFAPKRSLSLTAAVAFVARRSCRRRSQPTWTALVLIALMRFGLCCRSAFYESLQVSLEDAAFGATKAGRCHGSVNLGSGTGIVCRACFNCWKMIFPRGLPGVCRLMSPMMGRPIEHGCRKLS